MYIESTLIKRFKQTLKWFLSRLKQYNRKFITEKIRPIYPSKLENLYPDLTEDVAILIQGNIINKFRFTEETIRLYRKNFPKAKIILSTWESEKSKLRNLEGNNIKIIYGEKSRIKPGISNCNLQIVSTQNGLRYIKKKGFKYSLKTRTDQRFYNRDLLIYLKLLLKTFPLNNKDKCYQKDRLIGISFNSFLYRLYGLSDMFLFGTTDDVYNYWNCKLDNRDIEDFKENKKNTSRYLSSLRLCEVYFMTEFLKNRDVKLKWTLKHYWNEIAKRFLIVDSNTLDFFWPKYSHYEDRWKVDDKLLQNEFSFATWLKIYNGEIEIDESILDLDTTE